MDGKKQGTAREVTLKTREVILKMDDESVIVNGFELPGIMAISYEELDWSGIGYLTVKMRIDSREISKGGKDWEERVGELEKDK